MDAVFELARLRAHLGGMVDAYRVVHELDDDVTYHGRIGCGDTKSRLDRQYFQISHVTRQSAPCLRHMHHVRSEELAITMDGNNPIASDHDAVVSTLRLGDIQKPIQSWKYTKPQSPAEIEEVRQAVAAAAESNTSSPEITLHAINEAAKAVRNQQIKTRKTKRYQACNKLLSKIKSAKDKR